MTGSKLHRKPMRRWGRTAALPLLFLLYNVQYHHAVGCRNENFRLPEKCLVLFSLFIGQPREILKTKSADEEGFW